MNNTPNSERKYIAFFGCRNAGKSSILNAVTGQHMAIVSDVLGTTTDPVYKAMELLPAGPVMMVDTPGLDDEGELGAERIKKALQVLRKTDVAVMVVDGSIGMRPQDLHILEKIKERNVPCILVMNKSDLVTEEDGADLNVAGLKAEVMHVSAKDGQGIWELKEKIAEKAQEQAPPKPLVSDLVDPEDFVILVVPIDKAAPKGRLILPQQQVIRDLLEAGAAAVVVRDSELEATLNKLETTPDKLEATPPKLTNTVKLVICDSQVFKKVADIVPEKIPLTSFSILFSRYKGELGLQLEGIGAIQKLEDGDKVLIAEGCTHHRQCGDIGTEKIPHLLEEKTGKKLDFHYTSGVEFPENLSEFKLIIHCGGCMLNETEMKARLGMAEGAGVPITNYGMVLAEMSGVLERSMAPVVQEQ